MAGAEGAVLTGSLPSAAARRGLVAQYLKGSAYVVALGQALIPKGEEGVLGDRLGVLAAPLREFVEEGEGEEGGQLKHLLQQRSKLAMSSWSKNAETFCLVSV